MAIVVADLKFFQSERMTDESDGGGRMSAVEIASGTENSVFDDLSDVDRAAGDVSIRKVYAAVTSETNDKYLDAGVVIFKPPADPAVSVLAFSTADSYDERNALKNKLESSITRGSRYGGYLWGDHTSGQRAVTLWQRPTTELPAIGRRLEIAMFSGGVQMHSQVLWITRVTESLITRYDSEGGFQIRRVICEIAEALTGNYTGLEPIRYDTATPDTHVYDTRYNSGALPLFGAQPLAESASVGDHSVRVEDLYAPLIPTAFVETALPDATPGGDSAALVAAAAAAVSFTTTLNVVGPGKSLFLGSGVKPGTVSIVVSGSTISDLNGYLMLAGAQVGTIRYSQGVCVFNDACPSYGTTSKAVNFIPAALPLRVEDTAAQAVTVENRGFVWVLTVAPIPAPGSLRVSYRVNNAWYTIIDGGGGLLSGADSSYGSGTVDFTTGTVVLQTGELPDVGSEILYAWSTAVNYITRGGDGVAAPVLRFKIANPSVLPGSVTAEWVQGTTTYTITDVDPPVEGTIENLHGTGGKGFINYATGEGWIQPATVPAMGTEFSLDYEFGDPAGLVTETIASPALSATGMLEFTLDALPKAGTLKLSVPVTAVDFIGEEGQDTEIEETIEPPPPPDKKGYFGVRLRLNATIGGRRYYGDASSTTTFDTHDLATEAKIAVQNAGPISLTLPGSFTVAGCAFAAPSLYETIGAHFTGASGPLSGSWSFSLVCVFSKG